MNLAAMMTRLRRRTGNPTTTDVPDADLTENINSAYREISDKFRFHLVRKICTFNTSEGVSRYGLPTDLAAILRMRNNTSEKRLEKFDVPRRYAVTGYTGANISLGVPVKYIRFLDWVELIPIPDGVYEIEIYYKISIVDLVNGTDTPVLPESWHEGILKLAKYYYYTDQGDLAKSYAANDDYKVWAADKPVEVDEEKIDYDSGVGVPTLEQSVDARLDFDHSP